MLSVVTPSVSQRLTSEARAREHLRLTEAVAASPYLLELIDAASDAIANHCNRVFGRETVAETVRSFGRGAVILARAPVLGDVYALLDDQLVTAARLECNRSAGLLWRLDAAGRCPWSGRAAVLTYTAGWVLPEDPAYGTAPRAERLPSDVEKACLIIVAAQVAGRDRDPMLRSESTEGTGSASYIATADMGALPPQAAALLAPYHRPVFA